MGCTKRHSMRTRLWLGLTLSIFVASLRLEVQAQ